MIQPAAQSLTSSNPDFESSIFIIPSSLEFFIFFCNPTVSFLCSAKSGDFAERESRNLRDFFFGFFLCTEKSGDFEERGLHHSNL